MSISIQFLGAAGGVTGSQFLVTAGERRILVDCGMFQGSPEEVERNRMPFAFEPDILDAVILTHAHLDHCGRLPALVKAGYHGPIHATRATVDLAEIVLRDSAKLQVEFTNRWNRRQAKRASEKAAAVESEAEAREIDDESLPERMRSAPPEGRTETREALYDEHDVDATMELFVGSDYTTEIAVTDGVSAVLHDAGPHPGFRDRGAAGQRRGHGPHARLLRGPWAGRLADPARPDTDHPCRSRGRGVDVRQPGARPARRGDR